MELQLVSYNKGNQQQNEKATYETGQIICKWQDIPVFYGRNSSILCVCVYTTFSSFIHLSMDT